MEMEGFPQEEFEREVKEHTGKDVMSYGFRLLYSEDTESKGIIGAALFARRMKKFHPDMTVIADEDALKEME